MLKTILMVLSSAFIFASAGAEEAPKAEAPKEETQNVETAQPTPTKATKKESKPAAAASKKSGDKKMDVVVMETSLGKIEIELNREKAPKSTENYLTYVDAKHYDGTIFHRVINGFMIQGGGFDDKMKEKSTRAPIPNEAANGLKNERGSIAMARTMDPNSATAQFYINVVDNPALDFRDPSPRGIGYAVFGKVTSGMDVVDKIKAVATGVKNGMEDVPSTPVVIKSIRRK